MPTFRYKAVSPDGAAVNGVVDAYDRYEALIRVKQECPVVLSVERVASLPNMGVNLFDPQRIQDKQLSLLSSQFAIILRAGIPLVRAVELIGEQTGDKQLKKLLGEVGKDVAAGYGLAASLENKGSRILPATFIETVRAGEESGTLPEAFDRLKVYYEKAAKVRQKVTAAMAYPIFLLILAAIVIAIIMAVAMPTFVGVFESLDMELPGLTKAIIAVSNFFSRWWWFVALVILAAALGIRLYIKSEKGALQWAKLLLRMPVLGRVNRMKGASQLANTVSTLLTAGVPLIRAVEIVANVLDNRHLGRELGLLIPYLEEGRGLGEQLRRCKCFPEMLCEMTVMGEDSGSLESTLDTMGEFYDAETENASNRALSMLQPAITVFMGILIGLIVVGLYLPMFTMYLGL